MKVLIACEFSGVVRRAFAALGYDAWSCDLLPSEDDSKQHHIGDVRKLLDLECWDLMIGHPPCTRLANSSVRWLSKAPPGKTLEQMWRELDEGTALFSELWNATIPRICIENPIMHLHAKAKIVGFQPRTQSIQPWQHGHGETKATHLWLRNLPKLIPTNIVAGREPRVHKASPGPDRWKERSRTYEGIAAAMAEQWGAL